MTRARKETGIVPTAPAGGGDEGIVRAATDIGADGSLIYERDVTLADGQGVEGIFLGEGSPASVTDAQTGEVRELRTWRIRSGRYVARILGSAILDRRLADVRPGSRVGVIRVGTIRGRSGRLITDWAVGAEETE